MRALLVTSRVTFLPQNYDDFVCRMAACPEIAGLLVLDNWSLTLAAKAFGLMALGAPRLGTHLLANLAGASTRRRRNEWSAHHKPIWTLPTINCPEALELVRREQIDLIINARTRFIYKREILDLPPLGCINIHHGLLPAERGTMCDLWALSESRPAGFSIHVMRPKIDDGELIRVVTSDPGTQRNYPCYLQRSAALEATALSEILSQWSSAGSPDTSPNTRDATTRYRRNPNAREIRVMKRAGMKL